MGEVKPAAPTSVKAVPGGDANIFTTRFDALLAWARKYSLFQYPFVTACCGMEFMAVAGPRYDVSRFGAEAPRFSPRQADVLWIVGTISQRQGPALKRIYEQMTEPKWVISFGTCAACGGFYDNYTTIPGADKIIPVDVYIPGCPPRPEAVLDGLMLLMEKIQKGSEKAVVVPPREVPKLAQIRAKTAESVAAQAITGDASIDDGSVVHDGPEARRLGESKGVHAPSGTDTVEEETGSKG